MLVKDKINLDRDGLSEHGPITIAVLGDSVTHGAFEIGEIDYESVYWNLLRKKINQKRNYVPVTVINAGIGGTIAAQGLERLDSQVLSHNPDLVIVCYGLNDVNYNIQYYLDSLRTLLTKIQQSGCDLIFLTPNMLNTSVADDTHPDHRDYAAKTCEMQNSGRMDKFVYASIDLANELGVKVCDCYSKWKELSKTKDVTYLLANRINHPTREMHNLFADSLFNIIFDEQTTTNTTESTMIEN